MATHKASSNQQSQVQSEAGMGEERYKETYKLKEHNNNQQHTTGTKTRPYTNKAPDARV
jgi:hypothetical protein